VAMPSFCKCKSKKPAITLTAGFFRTISIIIHTSILATGPPPPIIEKRNFGVKFPIPHSGNYPRPPFPGVVRENGRHNLSGVAAGLFPEAIRLHDKLPDGWLECMPYPVLLYLYSNAVHVWIQYRESRS